MFMKKAAMTTEKSEIGTRFTANGKHQKKLSFNSSIPGSHLCTVRKGTYKSVANYSGHGGIAHVMPVGKSYGASSQNGDPSRLNIAAMIQTFDPWGPAAPLYPGSPVGP